AIPPSSAHELSAEPELRSRDRTVLAALDDLLSSSRRDARTREPFDWGDILHFGALKRSFTSLNRSFGTLIDSTYCSISHRPPEYTSTPLPRAGPRFGVSRSSSNHAVSPRTVTCRRTP